MHQLEKLFGQEDHGAKQQQHPNDNGHPSQLTNLFIRLKAVAVHRLPNGNLFDLWQIRRFSIGAVVLDDALCRVDVEDEGRVDEGEEQVEEKADEEKLADFQPFQVEEAFA